MWLWLWQLKGLCDYVVAAVAVAAVAWITLHCGGPRTTRETSNGTRLIMCPPASESSQ